MDTIAHTRAQLDELLKRVDQERGKALDRVRVEFQQFEVALKKRLSSMEQRIEEEVNTSSGLCVLDHGYACCCMYLIVPEGKASHYNVVNH